MKIIVLSPHRDDAAFSLSISILVWLNCGYSVEVVNCFTISQYAPFAQPNSNEAPAFVSEHRALEDRAWATSLGRGLTLTNLSLLDAPLRIGCPIASVCDITVADDHATQSRIETALLKAGADAAIVPLALGNHVDHRVARDAFLQSPSLRRIPFALYEDLPYAARPTAASTIETLIASIGADVRPSITRRASAEEAVAFKRSCAQFYDSQIDEVVADQIAEFCTHYAGGERIWTTTSWDRVIGPINSTEERPIR